MQQQETLISHINEFLPGIDQTLSAAGVEVSERSMKAAMFFVDHLVLDVEGDTKENYLLKSWFKPIFGHIQYWYEKRYGQTKVHPNRFLAGVLKHHGAFFLLHIPLAVAKPQGDGTCWVTFAKDVLPGEDPASWMTNGPSLEQMPPKQLAALRKEATNTATRLRGIRNHLMTADLPVVAVRAMANSVLRHLDKAAADLSAPGPEALSLSVWDLHMACEKVMKAYLNQQGIPYEQTHNLRDLVATSPKTHDWSAVKTVLGHFPSEQRVMKWRYQEGGVPSLNDLWRFYDVALEVCSIYAARMSRRFLLDNFSVQIRRPPWLESD